MKYTSYIVGIVIFSAVMYLFISAAGQVGETYESRDYQTYQALAGNYNTVDSVVSVDNSTLRKISNALEGAKFTTIASVIGGIDQGVEGTKFIGNSIETSAKVAATVTNDSGGLIDPYLQKVFNAIISVLIIMVILFMIMKAKAED